MSSDQDQWTKEYIDYRDRAATKYFNDWTCGDAPSFRDGADFGAAYERERAKVLVEALKWIFETDSRIHSDGSIEVWGCGEKARKALAKYGEK